MIRAVRLVVVLTALLLVASELSVAESLTACVETGQGSLDNPHDIKLSDDGRTLYVADTDNDRIVLLDPFTLSFVGDFGKGDLDGVRDIDVNPTGKLYAADTHNNRIAVYDVEYDPPRLVGKLKGGISRPESVLAHPNGDIYVSGAWSRNVVAFRDGQRVAVAEGLSAPRALAVGKGGRVWVGDSSKRQLLVMSPGLQIERIIGGQDAGFVDPHDVQVIGNSSVIIAEKFLHRIKIVSLNDGLSDVIGIGRPGKNQVALKRPSGIELRGNDLWIADSGNNRVLRCKIEWKRS